MKTLLVAVVGGSECSRAEAEMAEDTGELLAAEGVAVVCGGRGGVMEAVCRGAAKQGGMTVGVLPGLNAKDANAYVTVPIPTGLGQARNAVIAAAGMAMIAIGGSYGTLSEVALALRYGRPVIGLGSWQATTASGEAAAIQLAESPSQAVELAMQAISRRASNA